MIGNLQLENFKIFNSRTEFYFAPLTILTGANNSGKSTVLQALRIINQEVFNKSYNLSRLRTSSIMDQIGNINDLISYKNKNGFSFQFPFYLGDPRTNYHNNPFLKNLNTIWSLKVVYKPILTNNEEALLTSLILLNSNNEVAYEMKYIGNYHKDNQDYWTTISLDKLFEDDFNGSNYLYFDYQIIKPTNKLQTLQWESLKKYYSDGYPFYEESLKEYEKSIFHRDEITGIADLFDEHFDHFSNVYDYLSSRTDSFGKEPWYKPHVYPTKNIINLSEAIQFLINKIFHFPLQEYSHIYLPPLRGLNKRIFSNNDDIPIIKAINRYSFLEEELSDKEIRFLKKWLNVFIGGDELEVSRYYGVASSLKIFKNSRYQSIADLGYGASQFLPILLEGVNISMQNNQENDVHQTLLIEEPEANLHPNLQSLLADFFIDLTQNLGIQVIIETHSEYLIRKLQYLVAKKLCEPTDLALYYFEGAGNVRKINFLSDGKLDKDFGPGFLDEANNLSVELFRLHHSQNN
jgi:AAA15 family ATPase/GTPase